MDTRKDWTQSHLKIQRTSQGYSDLLALSPCSLLEEVSINPIIESPELKGLGKQMLGGHKQNLVHTRTQKKRAVISQETDVDLPVNVQKSPVEAWVVGGLLLGWGH